MQEASPSGLPHSKSARAGSGLHAGQRPAGSMSFQQAVRLDQDTASCQARLGQCPPGRTRPAAPSAARARGQTTACRCPHLRPAAAGQRVPEQRASGKHPRPCRLGSPAQTCQGDFGRPPPCWQRMAAGLLGATLAPIPSTHPHSSKGKQHLPGALPRPTIPASPAHHFHITPPHNPHFQMERSSSHEFHFDPNTPNPHSPAATTPHVHTRPPLQPILWPMSSIRTPGQGCMSCAGVRVGAGLFT